MAAVNASTDTPTFIEREGKEYYARNCWKGEKHTDHLWKTFYYSTPKDDSPNAWCDGTGNKPVYTHSTSYTAVKKDYSQDSESFPVTDPITVSQARKIALDMHSKQKDKAGRPYGEHLNAVAMGVQVLGGSPEEQIAAYFHDAVEDHHTTYDLLRKIHVTENTITMIEAVSKRSSEEQGKYLQRIIAAGHGACRVKLADLLHNTRHDRIQALRDDKKGHTADRLLKKYRPAMAALMLELGMIVTEDEQKKFATKPQGTATGSHSRFGSNANTRGKLWEVSTLFRGDWPSAWKAPILQTDGDEETITFYLANGEVKTMDRYNDTHHKVEKKLFTYTKSEWSKDNKVTFSGVSEDLITEYLEIVEAQSTVPESDEDWWESQDAGGKYLWDSGI